MTLLVVCGLIREARLVRQLVPIGDILIGGGQPERLRAELIRRARHHRGAILSAGIAGALDPELVPGDIMIDGDPDTLARLKHALPAAIVGKIYGQDTIAADPDSKCALVALGMAVDMESHIAAEVARAHGLPFGAVRVISDTAHETLPPAALVGMKPDGGMALGRVLVSLARRPAQLPDLIRIGRQSGLAFRNLAYAIDALERADFATA
ncbi:MAG: phosphorylase [Novosphingobium sp.]